MSDPTAGDFAERAEREDVFYTADPKRGTVYRVVFGGFFPYVDTGDEDEHGDREDTP